MQGRHRPEERTARAELHTAGLAQQGSEPRLTAPIALEQWFKKVKQELWGLVPPTDMKAEEVDEATPKMLTRISKWQKG